MPITRFFRPLGAFAIVGALSLTCAAGARAATKGVDLRVAGTSGQTLAEWRQFTGPVKVGTDPDAECFGEGNGGSGDRASVPGKTPLGAVRDAADHDRGLRPLSITDAFVDDGFGLGVCGIGGFEAAGSAYWTLKVDHADPQMSGSLVNLRPGDDVLWYLTPSFPPPPELALKAPPRAEPGVPFEVKVRQYSDTGETEPAGNASVTGALAPTLMDGRTMVTLAETRALRATRGGDIPSNRVRVCVSSDASDCPAKHGRRIVGSDRADRIRDTKGWDRIAARGGDDRVDIRSGGHDRVSCGGGEDVVVRSAGDGNDQIAASCEEVVKR
jgi:hypothetical protein